MKMGIRKLTDDQKAVVQELFGAFKTLISLDPDLTEKDCCRKFVPFDWTNLGKLRDDVYCGDTAIKVLQCRQALRDISDFIANSQRVRSIRKFHWFSNFKAVLDAITIAKSVKNENRLIIYLAPTGGGKSELCRQLVATKSASIVEAKPSWADSYFAGCLDVCASVGARGSRLNKREAEQLMLTSMLGRQHILAFDEGATSFGLHTARMLKLILNQTYTIPVMCGVPELIDRMMKSSEGRQLMRRSLTIIRALSISEAEAAEMLPFTFASPESLHECVRSANSFGAFDTLVRIADTLSMDHEPGDTVEHNEVKAAINLSKKHVGLAD